MHIDFNLGKHPVDTIIKMLSESSKVARKKKKKATQRREYLNLMENGTYF